MGESNVSNNSMNITDKLSKCYLQFPASLWEHYGTHVDGIFRIGPTD